jgi:hypothetical protein
MFSVITEVATLRSLCNMDGSRLNIEWMMPERYDLEEEEEEEAAVAP